MFYIHRPIFLFFFLVFLIIWHGKLSQIHHSHRADFNNSKSIKPNIWIRFYITEAEEYVNRMYLSGNISFYKNT
jgi:hypothetical protein